MTNLVGAWQLADMTPANLPERLASAFTEVTSNLIGAKYIPVLYVGEQLVKGMNYMIICKQTISAPNTPEYLVSMVINCYQDTNCIVSIERIV